MGKEWVHSQSDRRPASEGANHQRERTLLAMSPTQYVDKVIELYRLAKLPRYYHPRIQRGRSPDIAAALEDLTAFFLAVNLANEYEFWVDRPLSFRAFGKPLYFDIALVREKVLEHVIEVKTDLGWERGEFVARCRERRDRIRRIRGRVGAVHGQEVVRVASGCGYHLVVVSGENFQPDALREGLKGVRKYEPEIFVYVLTDGIHPNSVAAKNGSKGPNVRAHAFESLLKRVGGWMD